MNIFAISSIIVIVFSSTMSLVVFLKGENRQVSWPLGAFCLVVAIWGIGGYKFSTALSKDGAFWGWQIGYICAILAPPLSFQFTTAVLKIKTRLNQLIIRIAYFLAGIFLFFNFFYRDFFIGDLNFAFNQFYYIDWFSNKNIVYLLFYLSFYWILLPYSFFLIIIKYRSSSGRYRSQLKYIILGLTIGWFGAHMDFLPVFHINIYPYCNFFIAIYPLFWGYSIIKYRLLDINIVITRAGIFLGLYAAILGLPFYLGYITHAWFLSTCLTAILASAGPFVFNHLRQRAEQVLLREQQHYQQELERFSHSLLHITNLQELLDSTLYQIESFGSVSFCAIYLKANNKFILHVTSTPDNQLQPVIPETSSFITTLSKYPQPVWAEDLSLEAFSDELSLVCPLLSHDGLTGFILLGEKTSGIILNETDKSIFHTLANNLSLALSQLKKGEEK